MDRNLVLLNRNIARLRRDVRLQSSEIEQLIGAIRLSPACAMLSSRLGVPFGTSRTHAVPLRKLDFRIARMSQKSGKPATDPLNLRPICPTVRAPSRRTRFAL